MEMFFGGSVASFSEARLVHKFVCWRTPGYIYSICTYITTTQVQKIYPTEVMYVSM